MEREREVKFRKRVKIMKEGGREYKKKTMRERERDFKTSDECEGGSMYKESLIIERGTLRLIRRELAAVERASIN